MECERIIDLLSDFLDGSIQETVGVEVTAHLRECRRCAEEAEGIRNTIRILRSLPAEKAPPELLERIRRETASESPVKPLWKKLFLPAHVKIPFEAAAAILIFLAVYSFHKKDLPAVAPHAPAARTETAPASSGKADGPEARQARVARPRPPAGKTPKAEPGRRFATGGGVEPDGRGGAAASHSRPSLPTAPAQRASTSAELIRPELPTAEEKEIKDAFPRLFAAPPPRLMRPVPHGREVTLEVAAGNRAWLEERISAAAQRQGGTVVREPVTGPSLMTAAGPPFQETVRVRLPADSAEAFMAELRNMGTIYPGDAPGWTGLPAGPSPGIVLYTVRIRVR